ncbi:DUF3052 family protein [Gandjariella thermophila]|uniref:DUF3052 domain-containing protein n=1 Tax=Gandjariella thermophila TaxID=1931992 RepID=A0A4D4J6I2_9PSEU|nr:DUF3052 family protein [Gandjariella thermophila]GDY29577.1 hypothetical protein GTS_12100 [Gandjariella thermophila]
MIADQGYSGTPLARKLGVRAYHRLILLHSPPGWEIPDLPEGVEVGAGDLRRANIVVAFYRSVDALARDTPSFVHELPHDGALWIAWPRRAAGHTSDVTENGVRELLLPAGLVDVKVAALGEDWSGLKFVWRVEYRHRHD